MVGDGVGRKDEAHRGRAAAERAPGGSASAESARTEGATGLSRRRFLTVAAASTATVWAAPALTTVTASPAFAQASPVPEPPEVGGVVLEDDPDPSVGGVSLVSGERGLPRTGNDTMRLLAAGAAAIAGGAAVVRATRAEQDDESGPTVGDPAPAG